MIYATLQPQRESLTTTTIAVITHSNRNNPSYQPIYAPLFQATARTRSARARKQPKPLASLRSARYQPTSSTETAYSISKASHENSAACSLVASLLARPRLRSFFATARCSLLYFLRATRSTLAPRYARRSASCSFLALGATLKPHHPKYSISNTMPHYAYYANTMQHHAVLYFRCTLFQATSLLSFAYTTVTF